MTETVDQKKCPFCAELIKVEAKICRFCQKEIVSAGDTDKVNKIIEEWKDDDVSLSDHLITCPTCSYEGKMAYNGKKILPWFRYDYWIYFTLISSFLIYLGIHMSGLDNMSPNEAFEMSLGMALFGFFWIGALALCFFFVRWFLTSDTTIWSCPNCDEDCNIVIPWSLF